MLVIAHRGANREAIENSWSAFELAIAAGSHRLELDVQLSKDGHGVIMHDDSLLHTANQKLLISQLTREDITRIKLANGEPIPFLDEVIERLLPRIELNIEIKGPRPKISRIVCELVGQHRRRESVIVSSFYLEPLQWIKENCPEVQRACLIAYDHWTWPFFAVRSSLVFLERAGSSILHPEVGMVDENLMDQALNRGLKIYAWAAMNGEEQDRQGLWAVLKTYGLHGLCTNYPRQLVRWLAEVSYDASQFKSR